MEQTALFMLRSGAINCPNMTLESMSRMNREPGLDRGVNCLYDATLHWLVFHAGGLRLEKVEIRWLARD